MRRIELGDFLVIGEIHSGIRANRLARMSRVLVLAESALAAPFAGFDEVAVFPELHEKAAVYASRLVRYHPLPDGNKRTAYDVMVEFIVRNGAVFVHGEGGPLETADAIENLAARTISERDFIEWVAVRIRHPP